MVQMPSHQALLLFRVGPILCCADTSAVVAIIEPRPLTRPPGSNAAAPGIFKHAGKLVRTSDLRHLFGSDATVASKSQRLIITEQPTGQIGFVVDEIIEVMAMPNNGFGPIPAMIPKDVFQRSLLWQKQIYLVTDFSALAALKDRGYLRSYLAHLQKSTPAAMTSAPVATTDSRTAFASPLPPPASAIPHDRGIAATPSSTPVPAAVQPVVAHKPSRTFAPVKRGSVAAAAIPSARHEQTRPTASASTPKPGSVQQQSVPAHDPKSAPKSTPVSPRASTSAPSPSQWPGIMLVMLFLSGTAGLVWWLVTPAPTPAIVTTFSPVMPPQPEIATVTTPSLPVTSATTAKPPSVTASDIPNPQSIPVHYAASIARDQEGITIELEAPTDDLVFTPAATVDASAATTPAQSGQATAAVAYQTEIIHIVVKGDTLWHIAKRYVSDPYRYPELARLSHIADPDLIYPGNRVRIIKKRRK